MGPARISPARGILIGLVISLLVWMVVAAFADGMRQSDVIAKRSQEAFRAYRSASTEQAR